MKIGLYFGSFNPIHAGHLIVAQQLLVPAGWDKVWFVLSPQNPLNLSQNLLAEEKRLILLRSAINGNDRFEVSEVELNMPKPSFTIDTLDKLVQEFPEHTFSMLLGSDNMEKFVLWKNYEKILNGFKLLVYTRGIIDEKWEQYRNIILYDVPYIHISATYIRHLVKEKKSIRYLVPPQVEGEIMKWYSEE